MAWCRSPPSWKGASSILHVVVAVDVGVALDGDSMLVGCPGMGSASAFSHGVALESSGGGGFLLCLL